MKPNHASARSCSPLAAGWEILIFVGFDAITGARDAPRTYVAVFKWMQHFESSPYAFGGCFDAFISDRIPSEKQVSQGASGFHTQKGGQACLQHGELESDGGPGQRPEFPRLPVVHDADEPLGRE